MPNLTDAIRDAIRSSDQTPYAIAKGSGVARSQLSRLLSGESGLTVETLERLAGYLGLRITIEPAGPPDLHVAARPAKADKRRAPRPSRDRRRK